MENRQYILDEAAIQRKITRLALEVIENNTGITALELLGVQGPGMVLAQCIQKEVERLSDIQCNVQMISLNKRNPDTVTISVNTNFTNKAVIVIDDVSNSGKTLLYALKPLLDFAPAKIQSLVLIARSHTSFPVRSDYTGLEIATTLQNHIYVETDGEKLTGAYLG